MDWEKLATSAVMITISKTERLSGFINSGDKEPCWDGNIYIHEGKNHAKKNIKKVATQVKGKSVDVDKVEDTIKYYISHDDLHAYMMNGGTFFFVVYIDKKTGNLIQIYYASLLPLKIMSILEEEKKRYQVVFRKFPEDNLEKTELFLNFYNNAQKQVSFAGKKVPTIEELQKQGVLESISLHYTGVGNYSSHFDFPKMLDGKSVTLYANIKGGTAPIPVKYMEIIDRVTVSNNEELKVTVNGVKYYDEYNVVTTAETVYLHIGSCVSLSYPNTDEKEKPYTLKVQIKGKLKEQILGIEFVLAMIEHGSFCIGEDKYPSNFPEEELKKIQIDKIRDVLISYRRIQRVLDFINVTKDLDIQNCTETDIQNLNVLIGAIETKKPVKEHPEDTNRFHKLTIANLNLAVVYLKNPTGTYNMWDYFGIHFTLIWQHAEREPLRISQFAVMSADDFLNYDNLNLEFIVEDYKSIEPHELLFEQGNMTMLEMLKAYDKKPLKEFLVTAKQLLEWLKTEPNYISNEATTINELQIALRERALNFDEKAKLHCIISSTCDDFFKIEAFLLLDEQKEAKKLLDNLTEEELSAFKKFPIYKFYKQDDDKAEKKCTN